MNLKFIIEFEAEPNKSIVPDKIRFTSSKNDQTSTLTLTFYETDFLKETQTILNRRKLIKSIYFFDQNYKFCTKDIRIVWIKGRPLFLEAIFLITSELESVKLKKFFRNISEQKSSEI
uniref:photosystem II protein psb28 n=1 Tax=Lietzensia polymorpha TaxID=2962110 RepID=UPI0021821C4A|nr:photosystem II protein psb28 [Lietzensia polymorpha]UVI61304.1 photosystem II protein psb28 [Lietzensia polymorpha]